MRSIRAFVYVGIAALTCLAVQPRRVAVVVGGSMSPTYRSGELVWTRPVDRPVQRGDVVIADTPSGRVIKRVAFVAGDHRTQWKTGCGWIDMTNLAAPYHVDARDRMRRVPVPAGTVFLLGDNLESSIDSRSYGPIPVENIRGFVEDPRGPSAEARVLEPLPQYWLTLGRQPARGA